MNILTINSILSRWALMASKDLGSDVNPIICDMNRLVKAVLEDGKTQVDIWNYDSEFNNMLLEFCRSREWYEDLDVVMRIDDVTMIDRSYVRITPKGLKDFDTFLMKKKNYVDYYLIACCMEFSCIRAK